MGFKTSLYIKLIGAQVVAFFISQMLVTYVFAGAIPIVRPEFKRDLSEAPKNVFIAAQRIPDTSGKFVAAVFERFHMTSEKKLPAPWVPSDQQITTSPIDPSQPTSAPTDTIPTLIPTVDPALPTPTPEIFRSPATPTPFPTLFPTTRPTIVPTIPSEGGSTGSSSQQEQQTLSIINQRRQAAGLRNLVTDANLITAARRHSTDLQAHNCLPDGHTGSDGSTPLTRSHDAGYRGTYVGETVACRYATPESVVDGWWASPPHKAILTSSTATKIGIAWAGQYQTALLGN